MIIEDSMGSILVDSKVSHLLIDQNGNRWELRDEGDGLVVELKVSNTYYGVAIVPLAFRTVKIKPDI